jgi:phosphoribosylamine---glycine ligase
LIAAHDGVLRRLDLRWRQDAALCVVMAARGYPDAPEQGGVIRGLDGLAADPNLKIFHAATRCEPGPEGRLIADGGRVLGVTALGADVAQARSRAYAAVNRIDWPESLFRRDIGKWSRE